jgi:hypothetical protein
MSFFCSPHTVSSEQREQREESEEREQREQREQRDQESRESAKSREEGAAVNGKQWCIAQADQKDTL